MVKLPMQLRFSVRISLASQRQILHVPRNLYRVGLSVLFTRERRFDQTYRPNKANKAFNIGMLLDHGANINATDHNGATALHLLTRDHHVVSRELIRFFLEDSSDPKVRHRSGYTPLLVAVYTYSPAPETLEILLEPKWGANVHSRIPKSLNALAFLRMV